MSRHSLFRATALDRLSSPEQLDERLRIVSPRAWLAFAALAGLLLAAAAWSVFARIPLHVSGDGVFYAAAGTSLELTVFVPVAEARQLRAGHAARIRVPGAADLSGEVRAIAAQTTPRAQLLQLLDSEATVDRLTRSGPAVSVAVTVHDPIDFATGTRCSVDIVVGEVRPAAVIFGR